MKKHIESGWTRAIELSGVTLAGLAMLFAPAASAQTNTVSKPAGLVRIVIPTNSEALVSTPFLPFNPDVNALFANQLSGATNQDLADALRQWDPAQQAYTNAYKADFTGDSARDGYWFTDFSTWSTSTLSFYPGDGFWIRNRQSSTQTVFLCGTVVLEDQSAVTFGYGLSLFAYPYSSIIALNDTQLRACGATNGDWVSELVVGEYVQSWLLEDTNSANHGKWVDASTNLSGVILGLGRGYWYQRATNSFDWQETRPYSNPFPTNENPPSVVSMTLNSSKDEVTLGIETTGGSGEKVDIYYKDLSETNAFSSLGWQLGAISLTPGGSSMSWTDTGASSRGKINTVYSRYYLVGRGDLDSDGDGVPDSRETFVYGSNPNSNDLTVLPFMEDFETNTVQIGDLNGQNKWIASPAGTALVQTNTVYQGQQALQLDSGTNGSSTARHDFVAPGENVVWLDFHTKVKPAAPPGNLDGAGAAFCFDRSGRLVVYDGLQSGTNQWLTLTNQAPTGSWARISLKMDYSQQKWFVCLNGADAGANLGFATANTVGLTEFKMQGRKAFADALHVATNAPADLSVDWDDLPNDWELQYFGNLDQPEAGDPDGDGLTNLQEYQYGSDPTVNDKTTDSDSDGLSNYDELVVYGTDPFNADSDGDGASDDYEVTEGYNPLVADQGNTGGPTLNVDYPADGEKILW